MIELTPEALAAASAALEGAGPVHMVNLVRYRAQADYGQQMGLPPASGRNVYLQRYAPAFASVAARVVAGQRYAVALVANVHATLVAPAGETWDDIVIVEYESFEMLRRILDSSEYRAEAAPHRLAALAEWRLIATTKLDVSR